MSSLSAKIAEYSGLATASQVGHLKSDMSEFRKEMKHDLSELRNDMSELRNDMKHDLSELRNDMTELRNDMKHDLSELRNDMTELSNDMKRDLSKLSQIQDIATQMNRSIDLFFNNSSSEQVCASRNNDVNAFIQCLHEMKKSHQ